MTTKFPKSPTRRGFVYEAACERLGLTAQWRDIVMDERPDGTLLCLAGYGELLIRRPGEAAYVLDLQTTAALLTFLMGDNVKQLIPAILRASLLAKGGKVAALVQQLDGVRAEKAAA
jgi:hypothetical protein